MSKLFDDDDNSQSGRGGADDFGKMFEASLKKTTRHFEKGQKVEGKIITIGKENIFVLIDDQEGVIARSEFKEIPQQGDVHDLFVIRKSDSLWEVTLKPSSKALSDSIQDAFDLESPIEGKVTEVVNGGFRVQIMGQNAFCPISQIDFKVSDDTSTYIGKKFDFIVTRFEPRGKNIVVSRRRVLEMEKLEAEGDFIQRVKVGEMLNGRITRLEAFGAFAELAPGIDGLIHISELGWSRVQHPSEVVKIGDSVTVKVLSLQEDDRGRLKISLSRKQAEEDPWMQAAQEYRSGSQVTGKIRSQERFGILVDLKTGVSGLIPRSAVQESLDQRDLEKKKPGEEIRVVIQSVNLADKKISLSLPRGQEEIDWENQAKSNTSFGTLGDQFKALLKKN